MIAKYLIININFTHAKQHVWNYGPIAQLVRVADS